MISLVSCAVAMAIAEKVCRIRCLKGFPDFWNPFPLLKRRFVELDALRVFQNFGTLFHHCKEKVCQIRFLKGPLEPLKAIQV